MKSKPAIMIFITLLTLFLIVSCFPDKSYEDSPSGFFTGIWHGWIAPLSLIIGFFDKSVRIYDAHNTGWMYDLGFYIAIISGFGSLSLFRSKKKND
ncbi:MAG: hypothetical protein GXX85_01515 [Ignavibacteria bacterium]|nr:hypothetical protein [Ignavibacteria bacterium]